MVIILLFLWFSQIFLLNGIYSFFTKESIKKYSAVIAENIDNPELNSLLVSISQENEISVYLLSSDGTIKSATERSTSVRIDKASPAIYDYWELVSENGGTYIAEEENSGFVTDGGTLVEYEPSHFIGKVPKKNVSKNIVYASEAISSDGDSTLVVIISRLEPLESMVHILQSILVVASVIALTVGLSLAFIASKGLAKPIHNLSVAANQLATGDYNVAFQGGGCSEISQLSENLNNTTKKLQKTDLLRKELLANVSHDLRTPLTMIGGYGEMMRDIPGENNAENIQIIIDETRRLTKLVNDALDLSKLQSGTFNYQPVIFCITDEVYDIVTQFEKLSAGKHRITFMDCGNVDVNADEVLISEAIYNLINNAVTHSGENAAIIVRQSVADEKVRISVIDNGCGIPENELEDIWERYQKGIRSGGGTGLGLAIVNSAVKLCGGTCGVISKLGSGSEFWIELPVYKE